MERVSNGSTTALPGSISCGMLREFGVVVPEGAERGLKVMYAQLANEQLNPNFRALLKTVLAEIEGFEQQVLELDRSLAVLSESDPVLEKLESLPGIGRVIATAIRASVGDIHRFKGGRTLSSWIEFTPKETSSGLSRTRGRMSKRGGRLCSHLDDSRSAVGIGVSKAQAAVWQASGCIASMGARFG